MTVFTSRSVRPLLLATLLPASLGAYASDTVVADALADPSRGEMLYENHCTGCHESRVHMRENRLESDAGGVRLQVLRWSSELALGWGEQEHRDVLEFLLQRHYRF